MKFYSESKNLIVWNPEKNKTLCKFKDGIFETDDPYIIDRLKDNYEHETILQQNQNNIGSDEVVKADIDKLSIRDLKKIAKNKGLKGYSNLNKENLLILLGGE